MKGVSQDLKDSEELNPLVATKSKGKGGYKGHNYGLSQGEKGEGSQGGTFSRIPKKKFSQNNQAKGGKPPAGRGGRLAKFKDN